jgi:uncharacterized DUF497 family protein
VGFDWDDDKNLQNISKHGLDFSDAWEVFAGPMVPELDLGINYGEIGGVLLAYLAIEL